MRLAPEGRKNLILAAPGHGALCQTKVARVMLPAAVAGKARSTSVDEGAENPVFGEPGMLPMETVCADAAALTAKVRSARGVRRRMDNLPVIRAFERGTSLAVIHRPSERPCQIDA